MAKIKVHQSLWLVNGIQDAINESGYKLTNKRPDWNDMDVFIYDIEGGDIPEGSEDEYKLVMSFDGKTRDYTIRANKQ
jgi:hypothetical protein